nr:uncharacterized protein LOC117219458 [Megalopta genalis]
MKFFAVCIFAITAYAFAASVSQSDGPTDELRRLHERDADSTATAAEGHPNVATNDDNINKINLGTAINDAAKQFVKTVEAAGNSGTVHKLEGWITIAAGGAAIFVTRLAYGFRN